MQQKSITYYSVKNASTKSKNMISVRETGFELAFPVSGQKYKKMVACSLNFLLSGRNSDH